MNETPGTNETGVDEKQAKKPEAETIEKKKISEADLEAFMPGREEQEQAAAEKLPAFLERPPQPSLKPCLMVCRAINCIYFNKCWKVK